ETRGRRAGPGSTDASAGASAGLPGRTASAAARGAGRAGISFRSPPTPIPAIAAASVEPGPARRPRVSALLLAAGASRRMGGRDKLLELAGGEPVLRRTARSLLASGVEETVVVLRPGDMARRAALAPLDEPGRLRLIENPRAADGMGTSLAAGLAALAPTADAVLIALADMPDLEAADHDRLLAAFDAEEGREIVRATAEDGTPGHPVLIGRRFFEPLASLAGDEGAKRVIAEHRDFVVAVSLPGRRALVDLDTPEAWEAWRAGRAV
ncbi:MAG: nucleotidyltransferase family protein, partial [Pseudomonadota bacterium]